MRYRVCGIDSDILIQRFNQDTQEFLILVGNPFSANVSIVKIKESDNDNTLVNLTQEYIFKIFSLRRFQVNKESRNASNYSQGKKFKASVHQPLGQLHQGSKGNRNSENGCDTNCDVNRIDKYFTQRVNTNHVLSLKKHLSLSLSCNELKIPKYFYKKGMCDLVNKLTNFNFSQTGFQSRCPCLEWQG